nr:CaiB/BaiF CoA-transferase family protein [uncultured Roseibium sp.]
MSASKPLEGLVVLEFAQFLAGPLAGLRLADLGAQVIKVERPGKGDLGRQIYLSDTDIGGTNTLFQAINRNKQSYAADMKEPADHARLMKLITQADVLIQNFRPGVFDRLGFSYETLKALNPGLIYASVTGYGASGPWVDLPGQDLLAQARSGVMWLNGFEDGPPQPVGLAVADMLAGHNLTQAILAALVRRGFKGQGAKVDTSLLESLVDFQFEVLTTHLNDGGRMPDRPKNHGAHAYLPAPYGVYPTANGYLALAMTPLHRLFELLGMETPEFGLGEDRAFSHRAEISMLLAKRLSTRGTEAWLAILQPADIWCAEVMSWPDLLASDGFKALDMTQRLALANGDTVETTRAPYQIDGQVSASSSAAPMVGEHTDQIVADFNL